MHQRPRELGQEFRLHVTMKTLGHMLEKTSPIDRGRIRMEVHVEQFSKPPNGDHTQHDSNRRSAHLAPLAAITILSTAISSNRITAEELKIAKHLSRSDRKCD